MNDKFPLAHSKESALICFVKYIGVPFHTEIVHELFTEHQSPIDCMY